MITRRKVLIGSGVLGCSLAASPYVTPIVLSRAAGENRLVTIILRGAMDGLDVVRPVGDPDYARYRPSLLENGPGLDLTGFYQLHPGLSELMPLWKSGELGFAQAVSTPYRDKRSHFDGQDILEAGTGPDAGARDGWLNRLLQVLPEARSETAFAIGREEMMVLSGSAPVSRWSPEGRLDLSAQARLLLEEIYSDDPLFHDASLRAIEIAEDLGVAGDGRSGRDRGERRAQMARVAGAGKADVLATFAAKRLLQDARIAAFSISGWDTHRGQARSLARSLGDLQSAILTLKETLGPVWARTAVVAMTEFGRTARENGSGGTDHGTGGAVLYAGGALRGGQVLGDWPGLEEASLYARRDLMPTQDVRAYPAWMLQALFGVSDSDLHGTVFPGLELGREPGLIA